MSKLFLFKNQNLIQKKIIQAYFYESLNFFN